MLAAQSFYRLSHITHVSKFLVILLLLVLLELLNMFRAKLIGTAMEVLAEVLDTMDIGTDGCLGEVRRRNSSIMSSRRRGTGRSFFSATQATR